MFKRVISLLLVSALLVAVTTARDSATQANDAHSLHKLHKALDRAIPRMVPLILYNEVIDLYTFDTYIGGTKPVLAFFTAPAWCGPCVYVEPVVRIVASDEYQRVVTLSVDTDQDATVPSKYAVRNLPTFILFNDGLEIARLEGIASEEDLKNFIHQNFA